MKVKALLTAGTLIASTAMIAAAPASAGPGGGYGRFMDRVDRQASRIEQGVRSGELTRREFRKLKRQNRRIRRMVRFAKFDDGHIDRYERKQIRFALNNASDRIFRKKHNNKTQYGHGHGRKSGFKSIGRDHREGRKGRVWLKVDKWF
jgi:hypothetical protein